MKRTLTVAILMIASLSGFSQNLDIEILRKINLDRNQHLDKTFQAISNSQSTIDIIASASVLGAGLISGNRDLTRKGLTIVSAYFLNEIATESLKHIVNRPRPFVTYPEIQKLSSGGSPSFPSGHTSASFATATSLSLAFPKWYVIVPAYSWATAVGYSRMHLGVHYPSDVLAGAIIGSGCAILSYHATKWINKKKDAGENRHHHRHHQMNR